MSHGINVDYINPFIEAVTHTFTTMAAMTPTRDRVFLKGDGEETYGVSGIIGLGGEATGLNIANAPPTVIMLCGLQGAGKTTLAGKLAVCS